jgi:hypothetical protein
MYPRFNTIVDINRVSSNEAAYAMEEGHGGG